jgi:hypothetical protein
LREGTRDRAGHRGESSLWRSVDRRVRRERRDSRGLGRRVAVLRPQLQGDRHEGGHHHDIADEPEGQASRDPRSLRPRFLADDRQVGRDQPSRDPAPDPPADGAPGHPDEPDANREVHGHHQRPGHHVFPGDGTPPAPVEEPDDVLGQSIREEVPLRDDQDDLAAVEVHGHRCLAFEAARRPHQHPGDLRPLLRHPEHQPSRSDLHLEHPLEPLLRVMLDLDVEVPARAFLALALVRRGRPDLRPRGSVRPARIRFPRGDEGTTPGALEPPAEVDLGQLRDLPALRARDDRVHRESSLPIIANRRGRLDPERTCSLSRDGVAPTATPGRHSRSISRRRVLPG